MDAKLFYANEVHARIESLIEATNKDLEEGQSLSVHFILNDGSQIIPTFIGYQNPNFVTVNSIDLNNNEIQVLLSHTNIQIVITILNKPNDRKPIGFQSKTE